MGMKEYVLWGGGLLLVLVVTHGLWQAWRSRHPRPALAEGAPATEDADAQMDIFEPAPVLVDSVAGSVDGVDGAVDRTVDDRVSAADGEAIEEPVLADAPRRGRRVVIPGKRTEPTVPRNDHLFKVRAPEAAEPEPAAPPSPELNQVVVIWVTAKPGGSFAGKDLVKALADNGLRYTDDALFRKFDVDSGEELFSVVNGLEPGTFDLSDLDALATPRVVILLPLDNANVGVAAFTEMLDAAQDISITLDGELKDEHMCPMTGQTIEHYRQRISDYKRQSLRK